MTNKSSEIEKVLPEIADGLKALEKVSSTLQEGMGIVQEVKSLVAQ